MRVDAAWVALARAALAVWLPALLPLAVGPLRESRSAVATYLVSAPILPGVLPAVLLRLDDVAFVLVAAAVTLVVLGLLALGIARSGRYWPLLAIGAAVPMAAVALGFAQALRA